MRLGFRKNVKKDGTECSQDVYLPEYVIFGKLYTCAVHLFVLYHYEKK